MSILSSSSTIVEIEAELLDRLSYEEDGSVATAKLAITAARMWLVKRPRQTAHGQSQLQLNVEAVQTMLDDARQYVALNSGTNAGVVHLSAEEMRD